MMIGSFDAVIFDMDGVISDTQTLHAASESEMLAGHGIALDPETITARFSGVSAREMFGTIFGEHGIALPDLGVLAADKWNRMACLPDSGIKEIPGARELIMELRRRGVPCAVGSASRTAFIRRVLRVLQIEGRFQAIASAEEVERSKPDPAVFLLAAQRLSIEPARCVVIEDGRSGMVAAKRGGMQCIGLVGDIRGDWPADLLATSHHEIRSILCP